MSIKKPSDLFMVLPFFRPRNASSGPSSAPENGFVPSKIKNHFVAWLGEFVGCVLRSDPLLGQMLTGHDRTFMFLFFAFSATQVGNEGASPLSQAPNTSVLLYISLAFGFSLAVNVWCFYRITGGLFNPAVSGCKSLSAAPPSSTGAFL
jgi:aquaporin related protein